MLQAAHDEGIIHRDLKPANLMVVDPDTPHEKIKVMDFGLAKLVDAERRRQGDRHRTSTSPSARPATSARSRSRGEEMDHRGDLYSVGVILFELLTGRLPFTGRSTMDVLLAHATEDAAVVRRDWASRGWCRRRSRRWCSGAWRRTRTTRPRHARELAELYAEALVGHPGAADADARAADGPRRAGRARPSAADAPRRPHRPRRQPSSPGPTRSPEPVGGQAPGDAARRRSTTRWRWCITWKRGCRRRSRRTSCAASSTTPAANWSRACRGGSTSGWAARTAPTRRRCRGLSWLGLGRRPPIDVELRLQRGDDGRDNQLKITVVFRSHGRDLNSDAAWRAVCTQIYCDLRGYLMGARGQAQS